LAAAIALCRITSVLEAILKYALDAARRHCGAEIEALRLVASKAAHHLQLRVVFDALGDGDHAKAVGEADYRLHQGTGRRAAVEVGNESPVDLDLVEGEAAQIAERTVTAAEVVHHQSNPELAQLMQGGERVLAVLHEDGLGDLELEPMRRQARVPPRRADT